MLKMNRSTTCGKRSKGLWKYVIITFALVGTPASNATAEDGATRQYWIDFHRHFNISQVWEYYGDVGFRVDPDVWQRLYIRPSLRWHSPLDALEGRGGLGVFYEHGNTREDRLELRPWLGAFLKWPRLGPLTISSYLRAEGRFIWHTTDWDLRESVRFRYKIGTKLPLKRAERLKYFYIPVAAEWFDSVGPEIVEGFVEKRRLYVGLGRIFGTNIVGEFHFILQNARITTDEEFKTEDYIFRLQIKYLWSTRDYMSQES